MPKALVQSRKKCIISLNNSHLYVNTQHSIILKKSYQLVIQLYNLKKIASSDQNLQNGPYSDVKSLKIQSNSTWNPLSGHPNLVKSLKIQSNSTWNPLSGHLNLEYMIASNETGLLTTQLKLKYADTSITRSDTKCISDLSCDISIVIKKADKGSAVVIQNRDDYIDEGKSQLSNGKFYQKMNSDLTISHNEMVKKQLFDMTTRGEITKTVRDYLLLDTPRTPKIHKGTTPPPGRPILSANSCPTEWISAFMDHVLRSIVAMGKFYLEDTTSATMMNITSK